jgi:carbamoyl-phosphate synthase large subunit
MNLLLTSVGRRAYMVSYFKEALKGNGLVHAANSEFTFAMQEADQAVLTPLIYDEDYIGFLINYCIVNKINTIVPLFDIDLPILSKNKKKLSENGITAIVSDTNVTEICNDKWLTHKFLVKNGFDSPLSFLSISDCKNAIENTSVHFPLILKPRWGMGSLSIYQVNDIPELEILYKKVRYEIFNSYLKFESGHDQDNCIIIQQKIIGEEYGIDVFNDLNGNYLCSVPKRKKVMRAGETDIAEIIQNMALDKLGIKLSIDLKHIANLDVDCIKQGNKYYILDMNCRFGGQYPFAHLAGVNFPQVLIDIRLGLPIDTDLIRVKEYITGTKNLDIVILNHALNNSKIDKIKPQKQKLIPILP